MSETDDRGFAPPNELAEEASEAGEYVFRFPVQTASGEEAAHDDPLVELVRGQLADLLDTAILTDHGHRVRVDGFRLLHDPDIQYEVSPQGGEAREEEVDESG
jgi:hypothetical protein